MMRINFYLMTKKGLDVLRSVCNNNFPLDIFIVIGKDGSIENDYSNEIEQICIKNNLSYIFRGNIIKEADYSIAVSWKWLLYVNNLIVIHDSLLPKYRGFAPLVNALKNGEKTIGVTAIFGVSEYDRGDIIFQEKIDINYPLKIHTAIEMISNLYMKVINFVISKIVENVELPRIKQVEDLATYSLWLNEDDYSINWRDAAHRIKRFVDATGYPYNGSQTSFVNSNNVLEKIKVLDVEIVNDLQIVNRDVGKIIFIDNGLPIVVCGNGLIKITDAVGIISQKSILPFRAFRTKFL